MRKKEPGRKRQDVYINDELWKKFGEFAENTPLSRSRWMELLIKEFNKQDPKDIVDRIAAIAKSFKK